MSLEAACVCMKADGPFSIYDLARHQPIMEDFAYLMFSQIGW